MMNGLAKQFHLLIIYYIYIYSLLFILYRLYLSICRIYKFVLAVFSGKLIARNSPINNLNSIFHSITAVVRSSASITLGTGITFALCHELDEILVSEGKEPYFVPGMKDVIKKTGMENQVKNTLNRFGFKDSKPNSITDLLKKMTKEERDKYLQETGQTWEDLYKSQQTLINKLMNSEDKKKITEEISNFIATEDPFKNK